MQHAENEGRSGEERYGDDAGFAEFRWLDEQTGAAPAKLLDRLEDLASDFDRRFDSLVVAVATGAVAVSAAFVDRVPSDVRWILVIAWAALLVSIAAILIAIKVALRGLSAHAQDARAERDLRLKVFPDIQFKKNVAAGMKRVDEFLKSPQHQESLRRVNRSKCWCSVLEWTAVAMLFAGVVMLLIVAWHVPPSN
jgi:hypothetical protein